MTPFRIGIDLGGTKIVAVVLDAQGNECFRQRVATPAGDYPTTLQAIVDLVAAARQVAGAAATVGIGTPGAPSAITGRMKNCNSTCLNDQPLQHDLQQRLGCAVRLANDANCLALSEASDGAGQDAEVVFGVILGTGVGGGLVVSGRLLGGANAIAGEWGHNPLPGLAEEPQPWPRCYCGRTGCVEAFLSGPAMAAEHQRLHRSAPNMALDAAAIAALAAQGDAAALATLERYAERLARALAVVINIVDPQVIVLGGGLSNVASLYTRVPQRWLPWVFSDQVSTRLLPARHGDASGVRGAARLW